MPITWNDSERGFLVALAAVATCYVIFLGASTPKQSGTLRQVLVQRYLGFVLLGAIPAAAMWFIADWSPRDYGALPAINPEGWVWLGALSLLYFVVSVVNAPRADNLVMYPQVRQAQWSVSTFLHEYASWIVYLFGYELLFRGVLLFTAASVVSGWSAIALMAVINALAHLPKGPKETIVSLPSSVALGYVTLLTGSIWVSFIVHCVLAISTSFFSFRANPEMRFANRS